MGCPRHSRELAVWMNGERVGTWALPSRGGQEFRYAESWMGSSQFRPLSLSLPAGLGTNALQGAAVESWFENLLPDSSAIRQRVQRRFQAASSSAFDLLTAVGRDCAGAVQVLPLDEEPSGLDRIEATPLSEQEIGQVLRGVVAPPLPGSSGPAAEELRLSVAGAQEKTALLHHPPVQAADGNGGQRKISARSPEPRQKRNTKTKVDLAWWRSVPVWPNPQLQKICARFLASATWPCC
ncbi:HipA N-terminal domain-containing protein [Synechococcus sp. CS-602]|uniref:HipA N-terminal domain-containing protein n=1 Tax=Synechococcaceae TaxID=1890426 RepID=UPI0008FF1D3E|nr:MULTISPECIES: HipA N-terminal domain-containing protein [Synechococcaceae]MCT0204779.1 HipA N-terminal domain-containing protein [Synechococcus sp. CS-602]MCT0247338.1 HipA N-terminal domain-containing protein [Synechococcus sp. CS-601]MCT4367525.1 HipA N-terminal domain-containing protein [Candidatus Regnicoccus frigidus MAG-AL2]TWB89256.1 HipA-like protein [Synechococcus sp. Ace-Pa]